MMATNSNDLMYSSLEAFYLDYRGPHHHRVIMNINAVNVEREAREARLKLFPMGGF